MDFIEISEGVSVRVSEIESVVSNENGLTCTVRTKSNSYQSTFPYSVLLDLINIEKPKQVEFPKEVMGIMKEIGTFAG